MNSCVAALILTLFILAEAFKLGNSQDPETDDTYGSHGYGVKIGSITVTDETTSTVDSEPRHLGARP
ncbi:hypothetical protein KIN20_033779 [Parelaphostrongylus tenuis]|uniref:Uncharacterized protein n=1 Tax=Parelaphostrongylus tenuis TaxID=148309 RepID=A0AAD5RB11_PARTN|nr:hypothetical protein KIN20_033779 [Parelaphostrongylus tenuis]